MAKVNHTTVVLTKVAQEVKDDKAPVFGLKNILSAGLVLFGRLTSDEQIRIIAEANSLVSAPDSNIDDIQAEFLSHLQAIQKLGRKLPTQAKTTRKGRRKQAL